MDLKTIFVFNKFQFQMFVMIGVKSKIDIQLIILFFVSGPLEPI